MKDTFFIDIAADINQVHNSYVYICIRLWKCLVSVALLVKCRMGNICLVLHLINLPEERYNQGRRLGVLGGANAPPKNIFAPPKDSLGGAK